MNWISVENTPDSPPGTADQQMEDFVGRGGGEELGPHGRIVERPADFGQELDVGPRAAVGRNGHDEDVGGLAVERAEIHAAALDAQGRHQAIHAVGLAVGNGNAVLHAGAHALLPFQNRFQHGVAVADVSGSHQQVDHLGENGLLGGALQVQADGFDGQRLFQIHVWTPTHCKNSRHSLPFGGQFKPNSISAAKSRSENGTAGRRD